MAFRDLMNNYFYGRQGKADYTIADMPKNRRELFGAVLKSRWSGLVGVNLLYALIWIPAVLWTSINYLTLGGMVGGEALTADSGQALSLVFTWLLGMIPCIAITGPFNAGVSYVLRNWARDQHSFVLSDFKDAVKGNWKQALAVSCVSGVLPLIVYVATRFYGAMIQNSPLFILPMALVCLAGILWSLSGMIVYVMMVTYDLKLKDVLRNSLLLTVGRLPWALLFKLITLAVPAVIVALLLLLPEGQTAVLMIASLLYLLFVPAFNKLITVSYANWLCETYMNPSIKGAETNIGLRPENWDDVEYRPEDEEE